MSSEPERLRELYAMFDIQVMSYQEIDFTDYLGLPESAYTADPVCQWCSDEDTQGPCFGGGKCMKDSPL